MTDLVSAKFPMFKGEHLISLAEILDEIHPIGRIEWVIENLWALGVEGASLNILDLEARATGDGDGVLHLSDDELSEAATNIHQVIDGDFFGYLRDANGVFDERPAVTLEAFDSTDWTVTADPARVRVSFRSFM